MPYQPGGSIQGAVLKIAAQKFVLPAIQREFVWKPEQICKLFDSVMQGYPFGGFLFWSVDAENVEKFRYYRFMCDYHERDNWYCEEIPAEELKGKSLTAVLDGQQRLTAFNIGLRGSLALRSRYGRRTSDKAYPKKVLGLDLLSKEGDSEEGVRYDFSFVSREQCGYRDDGKLWFPVPDILNISSIPDMVEWVKGCELEDTEDVTEAMKTLGQLDRSVKVEPLINYFEEENQELERVLRIFVRTNSKGTVLSHSDLLLSIAILRWQKLDARSAVRELVDELNTTRPGFNFSRDFVLKAGLMISELSDIGFKVKNFEKEETMRALEDAWDNVCTATTLAVRLVANFGHSSTTIGAHSAVLPIVYYIYKRGADDRLLTHSNHLQDRQLIREWLAKALVVPGIWGSGLDTLLTKLRETISKHGMSGFPLNEIAGEMAKMGKRLSLGSSEIDEMVEMKRSDGRLFSLLALLFPGIEFGQRLEVDHIFPKGAFRPARLKMDGIDTNRASELREMADRIGNLQLLGGKLNEEKSDTLPAKWLGESMTPDQQEAYSERLLLGTIPDSVAGFEDWYNARKANMADRIGRILGYERQNEELE